ncbi:ABC transporter family protein [Streptomyces brevispora]|uniref:ABC transporter family protein n=1 Tax=Streptomyces brevispora TaxID=887462 RepID=A0A561UZA8_9ACTN|nr:ATP-binding cassette domain-containing protein [Streptomyces brevispora]TWG04679.1 ABC transporter family protein [Streptomyces brevispora]
MTETASPGPRPLPSTAVRILATLTTADSGTARIAGYDVVADRSRVRRAISLTGQYAAVDETQTGEENLRMMAPLTGRSRADARRRAAELLERFGLTEAARRTVRTYSGGMRRRLDPAAGLVGSPQPEVFFLDEPTTGLDPRSRQELWQVLRDLAAKGATVLLTTQYLEEADRPADRIAVLDRGRKVAEGTADALKSRVGGHRLDLVMPAWPHGFAGHQPITPAIESLRGLLLPGQRDPGRVAHRLLLVAMALSGALFRVRTR